MKNLYFQHIRAFAALAILCAPFASFLRGATVYWDLNNTVPGSGGPNPSGVWNSTDLNWNLAPDGTGTLAAWTAGDVAVFAAGADATGSYFVQVEGVQSVGGLRFVNPNAAPAVDMLAITLAGGVLEWAAAGALEMTTGTTAILGSRLTGSGNITHSTSALTVGDSTLVLSGRNSDFSGNWSLSGGTTVLQHSFAAGTGSITLGNTATRLDLVNGTVLDNAMTVSNTGNEKILRAITGLVTINSVITQQETSSGNFRLEANANATLVLNSDLGGGAVGLRTGGSGLKILTGNNTYTGETLLYGGTTQVESIATHLGSGDIRFGTSTTAATLLYTGSGETVTQAIRFNGTTGGGTITNDGAGALIFNTVHGTYGAGAKTFTLSGTNTDLNEIKGNIGQNSAVNLTNVTKSGTGTWVLSGNNTFTGQMRINGGTLIITHDGAVGQGTLRLSAGTLQGDGSGTRTISLPVIHDTGTAIIGGEDKFVFQNSWLTSGGTRTLTVNTAGGIEIHGAITLGEGTSNRTQVFNGSGDVLINGPVEFNPAAASPTGALSYTGSGTLVLTATNTYLGTTTLNNTNGTLRVSGTGTLGNATQGNITVNAGLLDMQTSVNHATPLLTMGGGASGSQATVNIAAGLTLSVEAITFSGSNNNQTALIQGAGTLDLGSGGFTATIANSTAVGTDMSWTINTVTGSGVFTKAGNGTLDIGGVSNFNFNASAYEIQGGALIGVDSSTTPLILNGGVFEGSGSFTRSLGTGNGEVRWLSGGGGFSASGGDLTVTLGGAPDPLIWGATTNFVPDGAPLIFGSTTATHIVTFTHNIDLNDTITAVDRVISVIKNTGAENDRAILSGLLSNSTSAAGITKTGNGILTLTGANTFTGGVTVAGGVLQFSTVSNNAGAASNLGQGTDGITLSGGALEFIGSTNQTTNRALALTATGVLNSYGSADANITFDGDITAFITTTGYSLNLNGNTTSQGVINGKITQAGTAADINVFSGTWTLNGSSSNPHVISDDIFATGPTAVFQAGATGSISFTAGTSNFFYARDGGIFRLMADDVSTSDLGLEGIILADTVGATAFFDLNGYNLTVPRLDLGNLQSDGRVGNVIGAGVLTVNNAGVGLNLRRGDIDSNLAGTSAATKLSNGDVTFRGDNSGRTGMTTVSNGRLILDYSLSNTDKLGSGGLTLNGGALRLEGNSSASTGQVVGGTFTAGTGASMIQTAAGTGQTLSLNLGGIVRTARAATLNLQIGDQTEILTSSANAFGAILGGWVIYQGNAFATIEEGKLQAAISTVKDDVSTWGMGDDIRDSAGFSGTVGAIAINSILFESANDSALTVSARDRLTLESGGILVAEGSGLNQITGGYLWSGASLNNDANDRELIVHQYNTAHAFTIGSILETRIGLTKSGPGVLVLNGFNDFNSRSTTINEGVLSLEGGSALGDWAPVLLADKDGVSLVLNDSSETIRSLAGGGASGGVVDIGSGSLLLRNGGTTFSGEIRGSGSFILNGTGTLTLNTTAHGSFTGDLVISGGGQITLANRQIANFTNVGSVTLNQGSLLLELNGGTENPNKINNNASVTFINTGGITGLRANNDRTDASKNEVMGAVIFLGGANTISANHSSTATTGTQRFMTLTAAQLDRQNQSTLLVRGKSLGTLDGVAVAGHGGRIVATAAPTAVGGIIPWVIGDFVVEGNGASFVTHAATTGFRPLNLTTEYEQLVDSGGVTVANQVRYSSAGSLTLDGSTARTMNSLLIDNAGVSGITLDGAEASLNVASGAFLFTGAQPISVENFTDITTSSTTYREYVLHVVNTSTEGVTIASPFTTAFADFTKSGNGVLKLTSTGSTYTGQTAINQGVLEIQSLQNLGNQGYGGILFNGGTLRFGSAFDASEAPIRLGIPSTAWVTETLGGTLDTNGFDVTLNHSIGGGGNGGLTKIGNGILTLAAPADFTGGATVSGGTLAYGVDNALPVTGRVTLNNTGILDMGTYSGEIGELWLNGTSSTLSGNGELVVSGRFSNIRNGDSTLVISNDGATTFNGDYFLVSANLGDQTSRTTTMNVTGAGTVTVNSVISSGPALVGNFTKSGNGTLVLNGENTLRGALRLNGGTMILGRDEASGLGTLRLSSGTLSGDGTGPRVFSNPVTHDTGAVTVGGTDKITFTGPWLTSGGTRSLVVETTGGVEISGMLTLGEGTSNRAQDFAGSGDVLVSGTIQNNSSATAASSTTTVLQYTGTGTLTLSGVNNFVGRTVLNSPDGTGMIVVSEGSSLGAAGAIIARAGTLKLENGLQSINSLTMGDGAEGAQSIVDLSGGAITLGTTTGIVYTASTRSGTNYINHGEVRLGGGNRTFQINDSTVTDLEMVINAQITNGGGTARSITKTGNGVLLLNAANTYSAGTTVSVGTLLVGNTSGSATGTGAVTVSLGAILGGNGIVAPGNNNSITIHGTLQVGAVGDVSAQMLTLRTTGTGLVTLNHVVSLDLFGGQGSGGLNDSMSNDRLVVTGTNGLVIGALAKLQVTTSLPLDESWVAGTEWQLFDWSGLTGGITGEFSNLDLMAPFQDVNLPDLSSLGLAWDVSNLYSHGTIMVVPEPGRALLLLLGFVSLGWRRRR